MKNTATFKLKAGPFIVSRDRKREEHVAHSKKHNKTISNSNIIELHRDITDFLDSKK